jgi:hypothetical protein
MKSIEDRAKPVIKDLIIGHERRITTAEQELLSTWAVLKVMIAAYDQKSKVTVHYKQREYIMRRKTPPTKGWAVWIGSLERVEWVPEWVSRPMFLAPERVANRRVNHNTSHFNSNATTQILGKLYIHVIHVPMPSLIKRWHFPPHKGTLFRVWPPTRTSIKWPGAPLDDIAADNIADALFRYMSKVQREWYAARGIQPS